MCLFLIYHVSQYWNCPAEFLFTIFVSNTNSGESKSTFIYLLGSKSTFLLFINSYYMYRCFDLN